MILLSKKSMSKIIRKKKRNKNARLQAEKKKKGKKKATGGTVFTVFSLSRRVGNDLVMVNKCFYKGKVLRFKVLLNI